MKGLFKKFTNWDYLLFYRFLAFNFLASMLVGHAWIQGYVTQVLESDPSGVTLVIVGVFLFAAMLCGWKAFNTSREINAVKNGKGVGRYTEFVKNVSASKRMRHNAWADALKLKMGSRLGFLKYLTGVPVVLGLIGTTVGLILMMQGVPETGAIDASGAAALVGTMAQGIGVALYTTLVGLIFSLWASVNYAILSSGVANLIAYILEYEAKYDSEDLDV